jgi:hypothetical protein
VPYCLAALHQGFFGACPALWRRLLNIVPTKQGAWPGIFAELRAIAPLTCLISNLGVRRFLIARHWTGFEH